MGLCLGCMVGVSVLCLLLICVDKESGVGGVEMRGTGRFVWGFLRQPTPITAHGPDIERRLFPKHARGFGSEKGAFRARNPGNKKTCCSCRSLGQWLQCLAAGTCLLPAGGCQLGFGGWRDWNLRPAGAFRSVTGSLLHNILHRGVRAGGRSLCTQATTGICCQGGARCWQVLLHLQASARPSLSTAIPPFRWP